MVIVVARWQLDDEIYPHASALANNCRFRKRERERVLSWQVAVVDELNLPLFEGRRVKSGRASGGNVVAVAVAAAAPQKGVSSGQITAKAAATTCPLHLTVVLCCRA